MIENSVDEVAQNATMSKEEARREYQRKYYQQHKEKAKEYQRNYNKRGKRATRKGNKRRKAPPVDYKKFEDLKEKYPNVPHQFLRPKIHLSYEDLDKILEEHKGDYQNARATVKSIAAAKEFETKMKSITDYVALYGVTISLAQAKEIYDESSSKNLKAIYNLAKEVYNLKESDKMDPPKEPEKKQEFAQEPQVRKLGYNISDIQNAPMGKTQKILEDIIEGRVAYNM